MAKYLLVFLAAVLACVYAQGEQLDLGKYGKFGAQKIIWDVILNRKLISSGFVDILTMVGYSRQEFDWRISKCYRRSKKKKKAKKSSCG